MSIWRGHGLRVAENVGRGVAEGEISINVDPEEGRLWVIGIGEDRRPAFTNTALNASSKSSSKSVRFSRESPRETRSVRGAHPRLTLQSTPIPNSGSLRGATFECVSRQMNRWGFEHDK
jgi:hypothetical protein